MNVIVRFLMLLLLLVTTHATQAEDTYQWKTANGTTAFSDKPLSNTATKIKIPSPTLVTLPHTTSKEITTTNEQISEAYQSIRMITPETGTYFSVPPTSLLLSAEVIPNLQVGDQMIFTQDGAAFPVQNGTSYTVTNLERGTHIYQAHIINAAGKIMMSSDTVTIEIHQPTITQSSPKK